MQLDHLTPTDQAYFQIRLALQWACIDFFKYTNFANRCQQQHETALAEFFLQLAAMKQEQAMHDLELLLPKAIPTFAGWNKDTEEMCLTDIKSMILNAMHSELDQKGYLHRTVARKLRDIGQEELAMRYDKFEVRADQNLRNLQQVLDRFLSVQSAS